MKLKCSILVIIIVSALCLGGTFTGGYVIGKQKNTTIINNITNSSQAISQSIAVSSVINLTSRGNSSTIVVDIKGVTNFKASTISNGITNKVPTKLIIK